MVELVRRLGVFEPDTCKLRPEVFYIGIIARAAEALFGTRVGQYRQITQDCLAAMNELEQIVDREPDAGFATWSKWRERHQSLHSNPLVSSCPTVDKLLMRIAVPFVDRRTIRLFAKVHADPEQTRELVLGCSAANDGLEQLLASGDYLDFGKERVWREKYQWVFDSPLVSDHPPDAQLSPVLLFRRNYENIGTKRKDRNQRFLLKEKARYRALFDNVEGLSLDDQQRECILKDELNSLVIAGAGSGKTTTIVGKVKYLLARGSCSADELLVLSFTKASADEMAERIKAETGQDIDVMTFHKLGKEVIAEVEGRQPSVTGIQLTDFVQEQFKTLMKTPQYSALAIRHLLAYSREYKSAFDFKTKGDHFTYLKGSAIRTLKGEVVKSFEEMLIANHLHINGVDYNYEAPYEVDTADRRYGQYYPDFYLPESGVYIEHFGVDRDGNVPEFFSGADGKSAKVIYNEGISWKRKTHQDNGSILIETYSYEQAEGMLLDQLDEKLKKAGVKFSPMGPDKIRRLLQSQSRYEVASANKLMADFIRLMKANGKDIEDVRGLIDQLPVGIQRYRSESFVKLVGPIYEAYQRELEKTREIDFGDMINRATEYIGEGRFAKPYTYIIVDEYQDISRARYNLIKGIRDRNQSKTFCVGDDWQSIYRFAGSDIDLFLDFEEFFGYTEVSYIETIYRFPTSLIDLSSAFILKNDRQISKELKGVGDAGEMAYELVYGEDDGELLDQLKLYLGKLPADSSALLLGRYRHDLKPYLDGELGHRYEHHRSRHTVDYRPRADLAIEFKTAHGAKGLQADYVFILNNLSGQYGFPSRVPDDQVLELLLQDKESFHYAEERRLFYVALTRAKRFVYLMVNANKKSVFIEEIEGDHGIERDEQAIKCPDCRTGDLVARTGKYGPFYGCSNYPLCTHSQPMK